MKIVSKNHDEQNETPGALSPSLSTLLPMRGIVMSAVTVGSLMGGAFQVHANLFDMLYSSLKMVSRTATTATAQLAQFNTTSLHKGTTVLRQSATSRATDTISDVGQRKSPPKGENHFKNLTRLIRIPFQSYRLFADDHKWFDTAVKFTLSSCVAPFLTPAPLATFIALATPSLTPLAMVFPVFMTMKSPYNALETAFALIPTSCAINVLKPYITAFIPGLISSNALLKLSSMGAFEYFGVGRLKNVTATRLANMLDPERTTTGVKRNADQILKDQRLFSMHHKLYRMRYIRLGSK